MATNCRLKTVEASGTYDAMGRTLGSACRKEADRMVSDAMASFERGSRDWGRALKSISKLVPFVEEYHPEMISFTKAYAEGAGISFEEVFVLFCLDEMGLCTDVMVNGEVTDDGKPYAAHTEDWTVESQEYLVLVRAKPEEGARMLIMTHAGLEWITGINSAGLTISGNSLYQNDKRIGVPKLMVAPKVLASETIGEALAASTPAHRASSYNNNICHSSGEMYCVEGSATDFAVLYPDEGFLVHTNHYLHPSMTKYEELFMKHGNRTLDGCSGTLVRYHRARRMVEGHLGDVTRATLIDLMRDHVNYPDSICSHPHEDVPEHDRCKTTYAVLMDPTEGTMHICVGNPCEGEFQPYKL